MTKSEDLRHRWRVGSGLDFLKSFEKRSGLGHQITESPFGYYNDYIDLRGFLLPEKRSTMRKFVIRNSDMSYASFEHCRMDFCNFEHVLFHRSVFRNSGGLGNNFADCSFIGADMRGYSFGYQEQRYIRTKFEKCNFGRANSNSPEFDDCIFENCRLTGLDFGSASFVRCDFVGEIKDVWFRGYSPNLYFEEMGKPKRINAMDNVSFEHARLVNLTFSDNINLSSIKLPKDKSCCFYDRWKERLERLLMHLEEQSIYQSENLELFCRAYLIHAEEQNQYILSKYDNFNNIQEYMKLLEIF